MDARGLVFAAPRRVEIAGTPLPNLRDGDVLVQTGYSGISAGTELLAYRGQLDPATTLDETLPALSGSFAYPFRYGYSCVGRIVQSRSALDEGRTVFAFHPHQDRFVVAAADVIGVEGVPPRIATMFPLVETALQVSLDAGAVTHEPVVVLGLGAVGVLTAALLTRAGARVVAVDPRLDRRDAAAAFGVEAVDPAEVDEIVRERTGGRGVPLLVEVTGNAQVLAGSLDLLAHEGTALIVSWYGTQPVTLPLGGAFHRRRLVIRSSQVSTVPAALRAWWTPRRRRQVAGGLLAALPLGVLATHTYPLAQAGAAFAALDRGEPGLLHAALSYE